MDADRITCPYCWQAIEIEAPVYDALPVEFTTDCEVCCRPIKVSYSWDAIDAEPFVDVEPEM